LAQADNVLAEISKAIERRCTYIAGKGGREGDAMTGAEIAVLSVLIVVVVVSGCLAFLNREF
jgi:hypothetical protein